MTDVIGLRPEESSALALSLKVATAAVVASMPFAIAVGYGMARRRFVGKGVVELLINLPLVLPPVVTGYALLAFFSTRGPVGAFLDRWLGLRIVFTWWGAALASAVVAFPLMARSIRLAFEGVDPRLELAARSLGASPTRAWATVALPLAGRGVIAGALLGFARSLGEFGATIMIAGNIEGETRTIPLAIYSLSHRPDGDADVGRLIVLSVLLAFVALALGEWLERKRSTHEADGV